MLITYHPEKLHFTGTQINYYFICKRKLWLFSNDMQMEQESDTVLLGKLLHEETYEREAKDIYLDEYIRLDRIEANGTIHEVKKSNKMEDAHIWQLKYYLYYLKAKGIWPLHGRIDYPKLRKTVEVKLTSEDIDEIGKILDGVHSILTLSTPPKVEKMSICRKCAYYEFCWG